MPLYNLLILFDIYEINTDTNGFSSFAFLWTNCMTEHQTLKLQKIWATFYFMQVIACRYTIYWMPYRHLIRITLITKSILTRHTFFATLLTVSFPYRYYEPLYFFKSSKKIKNGRNSCLHDQSVELNGILGRRAAGNLFFVFTVKCILGHYMETVR